MNNRLEKVLPHVPSSINIGNRQSLVSSDIPKVQPGSQLDLHVAVFTNGSPKGTLYLSGTRTDTIGVIPPYTSVSTLGEVVERLKAQKEKGSKASGLIVASGDATEILKSNLPDTPVISGDVLKGVIKDEAMEAYGVNTSFGETAGTFQLGAFVVDRLILSKGRGQIAEQNHVYTSAQGMLGKPAKHAEVYFKTPQTLFVQKVRGPAQQENPQIPENEIISIADTLVQLQLRPADDILAKRRLLDHVPFSTGEDPSAAMFIAATEWAQTLGLPIGQVLDIMEIPIDGSQAGWKARDYAQLLNIVEEELYAKGSSLIEATAGDIKALNARLSVNPRLGQVVPSLYRLLQENMINFDGVKAVEKQLYATQFSGISGELIGFMPGHMVNPAAEDTPSKAVVRLDEVIQTSSTEQDSGIIVVKTDGYVARDGNGVRHREAQFGMGDDDRSALDTAYQGLYVFNRKKGYLEDTPDVERAAREFLVREEVPIILPAFVEETGWDVARAASELAPGRVILVSPDQRTLRDAAPYAHAIDQNEVLRHVDFGRLKEMGIIPAGREVPIRGKGTTILAGMLWGMANGLVLPGKYVAHVDTDITNMDSKSVFYKRDNGDSGHRKPYRPLEYMAAALAQMPASHRAIAVQPAKVGPPRKGEVKHPTFQAMMNSKDPFLRAVGMGLGRVVWPSPGEAIVNTDLYTKTPWQVTTGFDLDRYFNAVLWELARNGKIQDGDVRDVFAQVIMPPDKIENGSVPEKNDWAEVNWATGIFTHALAFHQGLRQEQAAREKIIDLVAQLPPEQRQQLPVELIQGLEPVLPAAFTIDHIKAFNDRYAGVQERVIASESPESHRAIDGSIIYPANEVYIGAGGANSASYRWNPWYLPSVEWMIENGIIDLEGIRDNVKPIVADRTRATRWE